MRLYIFCVFISYFCFLLLKNACWEIWSSKLHMDFPGDSIGKESACSVGDVGLIPGLGRSPGGGHGNPLQYSCLENPTDRGSWRAIQSMWSQRVRHNWATKHSTEAWYPNLDDVQTSVLLGLNDLWHSNFLINLSPNFNVFTIYYF